MSNTTFPLWSDEPATQDLLSFGAVASTVVDTVLDDNLDPIALGLSGAWGSGKTSVLELVKAEIERRTENTETKVLVITTQPWRYDPAVGPKESLIAEVLEALGSQIDESVDTKAKGLLKGLVRRVNWAKAFKMAAMTSVTLQLPNPEDLLNLVKEGDAEELAGERGLAQFREDFANLLASDGLEHISRVVVLVDDLDRCLPPTVVDTLEAIRLFLSADGMSFVIAADEDRVAEAIQQRLATAPLSEFEGEAPAKLYLHKIVQTTIPLPGLSRFDTQAYLFLLLSRTSVSTECFNGFVVQCEALRQTGGTIDDLDLPSDVNLTDVLVTASRLTPILYEKFHGNPRRIKRFLNDLHVRQSIAIRRGIELPSAAVAKLMVLERLLEDDFRRVLEWLASNQLRDRLESLDTVANHPIQQVAQTADSEENKKKDMGRKSQTKSAHPVEDEVFSDTLIRWAKLPPTLDASAVASYLYLAASFAQIEIIDEGLPERLRDIASALTSSLKVDRSAITDDDLKALPQADALLLIAFLGRRTRDQPTLQRFTVASMLRIVALHPKTQEALVSALKSLPANEISPATGLMLRPLNGSAYQTVLETWKAGSASTELLGTIKLVQEHWEKSDGN